MALPSKYVLSIHIVGWLGFILLPLAFIVSQGQQWQTIWHALPVAILLFSIYPAIFYLHTYWLFPRFYIVRNYPGYTAMMLLLIVLILFLRPFDRTLAMVSQNSGNPAGQPTAMTPPQSRFGEAGLFEEQMPPRADNPPPPPNGMVPNGPLPRRSDAGRFAPALDIVSILFFALTIGLSITVQATRRWRNAVRLAAQAETDRVNAELSFLKAQINPHFLFNTLNNIYSLALTKDDNTADSIMKLSNIMRYVTDEVTSNFVALESEAECIVDYIDLQRLRVSKKAAIDFAMQGSIDTKRIAPLILMTFVENAFKYGISSHEPSPITIRLFADEQSISFFCQNRIFPSNEIKESTGIGIANTSKRIATLYAEKHLLSIDKSNELFTVSLTLQV